MINRPAIQLTSFGLALVLGATSAFAAPQKTDSLAGMGGVIQVTPIFHASTQIEYRGKVILVDPVAAGTYKKKADLILITHTHGDHMDPIAIERVKKPGTLLIAPPETLKELKSKKIKTLGLASSTRTKNYLSSDILPNLEITAVPAYNIVRGPKPGQKFHPKGKFNGYVVKVGGKRLYFAGDTEAVPEMKALKNIYAAFVPMNLPYTMTPKEAADGVRAFKPKIVYPYHFRYPFNKPNNNVAEFTAALKGSGVLVRELDFYPAAAVKKASGGR